jgi:hypothetical protein
MYEIIIDEKFLENLGTASLEGHIFNKYSEIPKHITLVFKESSMSWRKYNGPLQWIINEYVPKCLVDSIIHLIVNGVDISTRVESYNPTR